MKLPIVILAVLGLVCGKPLHNDSLKNQLKEFTANVPTDKLLEIAMDYLANDEEVREFVAYIQSEEFPKVHKTVQYLKEYKDCSKYINDQGVDVYAIINEIHDYLDYPPFQPTNTTRTGDGLYGLIDDMIAVLPLSNLTANVHNEKETREFFRTLVTAFQSPEFTNMVDTVRSWPEYREILETLQEMFVDVQRTFEQFRELYMRGTHSFQDDLNDFMALVPTDKVVKITLDYLANDPELHEAFDYIQSEEFPKIHKFVGYLKEHKDCFKFINDHGFDIYAIYNHIQDFFDFPPFQPTNTTRTGVGIHGFVDDVIAVLPLDDLKALFHKKTETREFFQNLVEAVKSRGFVNMVESVRAWQVYQRIWPEYQRMVKALQQTGGNVDRIIQLLWEQSLRGMHWLQDEMTQFMAQLPTEKALEIAMDYLANDEEVREYVSYFQSEEFPKIHKTVQHLNEYKDCFKYSNDQGVDGYAILNEIRDFFDYPPFQPTNTARTGVGIYGLIDDEIAVLPLNNLTAFVQKETETREFFRTLVTAFHSPEFTNMVHTVRDWPEYREMIENVRKTFNDVERAIELFQELYWRGTQNLQKDVKDFMSLFPTDKVFEIAMDYLANDEEVREFVAYIQSEEFPKIHKTVEHLKKYKDCTKYINDQGVDVYAIFNEIHNNFKYPPFQPTNTARMGVGFYGLYDDVNAALPFEDMNDLFYKKMETREYFKALGAALKSPEFKNTMDTLRGRPEYQKMLEFLRQAGVYADRVIEQLRTQFRQHSAYKHEQANYN